jgi:hypothetical protein
MKDYFKQHPTTASALSASTIMEDKNKMTPKFHLNYPPMPL